MMVKLAKAKSVVGKNLYLRDIIEDDAEFILDLRTDPIKSKYLHATSDRLEDQVSWIRKYTSKTDQAYFVVCDKSDKRLGCIRMYDPIGNSYCWGSWLMVDGLGPLAAVESSLLVYAYGKHLGFKEARIDVRQANRDVWKFHEKFASAKLIKQDDNDRHYIVEEDRINSLLNKYGSFITNPLVVETFRNL